MPVEGIPEQGEGLGFAGLPAPLDELHHRHLLAVAQGAQHQTQGRGGFALAVAGEDQHQALLQVAFPHPLALHLLAPGHAAPVGLRLLLGSQIPTGSEFGRGPVEGALQGGWRFDAGLVGLERRHAGVPEAGARRFWRAPVGRGPVAAGTLEPPPT